jgi:hypothetical protein
MPVEQVFVLFHAHAHARGQPFCARRGIALRREIYWPTCEATQEHGKHASPSQHVSGAGKFQSICYANKLCIWAVAFIYEGSDPNGIRTQFPHFVILRNFRSNPQHSAR